MTPLRRIAVIGNSLPRRCGIATFTTDLQCALSTSRPSLETFIVAMTDHGQTYEYPPAVALQINDANVDEYVRAADFLNAGQFDMVSLQHEFGIFGGEAGGHILVLLSRLTMPVVTTLHTVLAEPTSVQQALLERIVEASSKVVVMAKKGRDCCAPSIVCRMTRSRSFPTVFPTLRLSHRMRPRPNSDLAVGRSF